MNRHKKEPIVCLFILTCTPYISTLPLKVADIQKRVAISLALGQATQGSRRGGGAYVATMVCLQGEPWCAWHTHAKCLGKVGADQGVQGVLRAN
jgi:hypothetical protein